MHWPIPNQGKWLGQTVGGQFAYFAVPTNVRPLTAFRYRVIDLWRRTLQRRSQKDGAMSERIAQLANDYLPKPCNLYPWPRARFAVKHSR
ncbi:retA reverse transcriptase [Mesorhizobium erdmanii]|uniref:RetA reverse transcriptase n=1 Tax=Mesorhizobium erdmanii TaxID=1777866 RepID=A0A6M7UW08_9HYPH|nr:retA reverse transcriptase [Mesorhizobium erdmanii]